MSSLTPVNISPAINSIVVARHCAVEISSVVASGPSTARCVPRAVTDARSALDCFKQERLDVVIIDNDIPIGELEALRCGLHLLGELKRLQPRAEVIMLASCHSVADVKIALERGAFMVIDKQTASGSLLRFAFQRAVEYKRMRDRLG